jgi:hypothetical protein
MDRIALAVIIGASLVFGCGVLAGILVMASAAIRRIGPERSSRRTRPHQPGTGPDDQRADQPASWGR